MYDIRFSIFGLSKAHDKEEEKMRNIKYIIACARSARTSPSRIRGETSMKSSEKIYVT